MMREWRAATKEEMLVRLADLLGVDYLALEAIGCAWAAPHHAWAFAMRDGYGEAIGIRLRSEDGKKWAVPGSKAGLFLPVPYVPERTAWVTEGATDTAAALSLSLLAFGRPSCAGGIDLLRVALRQRSVREVIIVSDNDSPGLQGAKRLATELPFRSCVLVLPAKDLREFVRTGGGKEVLTALVKQAVWQQPRHHE